MDSDSTTQIIQRRIRHVKTTAAGIATMVCPLAALFAPPEWAAKLNSVALVLCGSGLLAAADAKPGVGPVQGIGLRLFLATILGVLISGCSTFRSEQRETAPDGTQRVTTIRAHTFLDGRSDLAKLRANTTDKPQGMTIGQLGQETSGTNVTTLIDSVVGAAVRAAVGGLKP